MQVTSMLRLLTGGFSHSSLMAFERIHPSTSEKESVGTELRARDCERLSPPTADTTSQT